MKVAGRLSWLNSVVLLSKTIQMPSKETKTIVGKVRLRYLAGVLHEVKTEQL